MSDLTGDDAIDLLVDQLPRTVSAAHPDAFIDARCGEAMLSAARGLRLYERFVERRRERKSG